jgi:sugar phosphate isomerase/epimerase
MAAALGQEGIETWLAAAADAGVPYDHVGLQTYLCRFSGQQDCYQATMGQIQGIADLAGKPVTILEAGLTSTDPHHNEQSQAIFMQRIVQAARDGGARGLFVYEYLDNPNEPDHPERGFGLMRPDRTPKPAWQAYGAAIAALGEKRA